MQEHPPTAEIQWRSWGSGVFEEARSLDRLVILDSGATWCHWCHVMDQVTYEDPGVVDLLNSRFIPVRIDRDRLAEVDAHFQQASPLISSAGNGWPLTVVLTPDGDVLYKSTFLPPRADPRLGKGVGMLELLDAVDRYWRANRDIIAQQAREIQQRGTQVRRDVFSQPGQLSEGIISTVAEAIEDTYDSRHGGFGSAPKFFLPAAIELLLVRTWRGHDGSRRHLVHTLEAIARGGVHDQIGGGFHRYSVDERWHVPHFEKMGYDNAALLACYANAFALTGREDFAEVARRTAVWIQEVLGAGGGAFYASQDADIGPGDDGDYFTWTVQEVRDAIDDDPEPVLEYYEVDPQGDMHGRGGRNVLYIARQASTLARLMDRKLEDMEASLAQARQQLKRQRDERLAPAVDQTIFADINGMLIDAMLIASARLGEPGLAQRAIKALEAVRRELDDGAGVFGHFRHEGELQQVGLLADQAWMLRALIRAFCYGGDPEHLAAACRVADYILEHLRDAEAAFISARADNGGGLAGITPRRLWDDSPSRSPASVAAEAMIMLGYLTGDDRYSEAATTAMRTLAGGVERQWGTFLAGYALAVEAALHGPRWIVLACPQDCQPTRLAKRTRQHYLPAGDSLGLSAQRDDQRAMLVRLGYQVEDQPVAYVCAGSACLDPARTDAELDERMAALHRGP